MSGYVIAQIEVKDPGTYEEYRSRVAPTVAAHGGAFLVRGGEMEVLEGDWPMPRVIILGFPSVEAARAWYESDAYRPLRELRRSAAQANLILVEGV